MTSKERVLNAINHRETDRVPMDLGGIACSLLDEVYFKLKNYLGFAEDIKPFRSGANSTYYDERILDYFDIDIRRVIIKTKDTFPIRYADGSLKNEWGITLKKGPFGMEFVRNPLEEAELEDLEEYPWPKAKDCIDLTGLRETAKKMYDENRYAISLRAPMNGIFEISCWLRGMQNFMVDMLADEDFAHALAEKVLDVQMDWYGAVLDEIGPYVDIIETGDDYGSQNSLLISPECLDEFILSRRKRLNDMFRKKAPNAHILLHCCGSISRIIPAIVDTGVDILNPVQTAAVDMDPYDLKRKFGDMVCFHGGVDTQSAMRGSVEDVENEVKKMLDAMDHQGGYIISSCNHIQNDIPVENIVALFETARKYGQH